MTDPAWRFGSSATTREKCGLCRLAALCERPELALMLLGLLKELADGNGDLPSGPQGADSAPVPEPDDPGPGDGSGGGGDGPGWDPDSDPADPRRELVPAGG